MNRKINPLARKCCKKCGCDLGSQYNFANYCEECYKEITNKKQKHEEIKQMAWELIVHHPLHEKISSQCAWETAETFCQFAKEKEDEIHE